MKPCVLESISEPNPKKLVKYFHSNRNPVHYYKDCYGHFFRNPFYQCSHCTNSPHEVDPVTRPKRKTRKATDGLYRRYLNSDSSVDTLGECDKFRFMISYAPSPPPAYKASPPSTSALPPSPPSSPPHKKPAVSPFYKPILKWAKKNSYPLELPSDAPPSQDTQKNANPSISMFQDANFFFRESSKLYFPTTEEFIDSQGRYCHIPKLTAPTNVDEHGRQRRTPIAEAVLSWQSETLATHDNTFRQLILKLVKYGNVTPQNYKEWGWHGRPSTRRTHPQKQPTT